MCYSKKTSFLFFFFIFEFFIVILIELHLIIIYYFYFNIKINNSLKNFRKKIAFFSTFTFKVLAPLHSIDTISIEISRMIAAIQSCR